MFKLLNTELIFKVEMMRRLAVLSLLIFIVFLAGCVGTPSGGGGPGVVIKGFSASPSTAEPGTTVLLQLFIQNSGGVKATDIDVKLLGGVLTSGWQGVTSEHIDELYQADPSRGMNEGEEREIDWTLTAPSPGKSVDMPYETTAEVSYQYSTESNAQIKAVTLDHLRRTNDKGGISFQKSSAGPISIKLTAPTTIISSGRVPVQIQVSNVGSGYVENDQLTFTVTGVTKCSTYIVRIPKGRTAAIFCQIDTSGVTEYGIFPITVSTSYKYFTDATTTITVLRAPPI